MKLHIEYDDGDKEVCIYPDDDVRILQVGKRKAEELEHVVQDQRRVKTPKPVAPVVPTMVSFGTNMPLLPKNPSKGMSKLQVASTCEQIVLHLKTMAQLKVQALLPKKPSNGMSKLQVASTCDQVVVHLKAKAQLKVQGGVGDGRLEHLCYAQILEEGRLEHLGYAQIIGRAFLKNPVSMKHRVTDKLLKAHKADMNALDKTFSLSYKCRHLERRDSLRYLINILPYHYEMMGFMGKIQLQALCNPNIIPHPDRLARFVTALAPSMGGIHGCKAVDGKSDEYGYNINHALRAVFFAYSFKVGMKPEEVFNLKLDTYVMDNEVKIKYGWIGQQSGSGFINRPPATLGVFASLDRF
jgi:hypothetical protein